MSGSFLGRPRYRLEPLAPSHMVAGDINVNTVVLSGDGLTTVPGDNPAGISKSFGGGKNKKKRKALGSPPPRGEPRASLRLRRPPQRGPHSHQPPPSLSLGCSGACSCSPPRCARWSCWGTTRLGSIGTTRSRTWKRRCACGRGEPSTRRAIRGSCGRCGPSGAWSSWQGSSTRWGWPSAC